MVASSSCLCGCGGVTGGRFVPGHDSKLKSALFDAARSGDNAAYARIGELGWMHLYDKSVPKPEKPPTAPRAAKRVVVEGVTSMAEYRQSRYAKAKKVAARLRELRESGAQVGYILNIEQVDQVDGTDESLIRTFSPLS